MAAWLAVSRVFFSRAPLLGDRDISTVMRCGPGPSSFPFRPRASSSMLGSPSSLEFKLEPQLFHTLRLPLDVTEARCECGGAVDLYGRHRAACSRSGRLRTRAVGPERTVARVCRGAGATVRWQAKLRDMNVTVSANDERAVEVLASGLPSFQGAQLAVDITIRSVLTATGAAAPNTSHTDGAALLQATDSFSTHRFYFTLCHGVPMN